MFHSDPQGEQCKVDLSDLSSYSYWCGYTDERTEGDWRDVNTDQLLARPDLLWWKAQPNGREYQNCMEATYYSSLANTPTQWNDNYCNTSKCYFCNFTSVPTFILRGMSFCQTEHFDQKYKWTSGLQDGRFILLGLQGSRITWTEANQTWVISSRFNREARTIYLQSPRTFYPGGLQDWLTDHTCGFTTERTEAVLSSLHLVLRTLLRGCYATNLIP